MAIYNTSTSKTESYFWLGLWLGGVSLFVYQSKIALPFVGVVGLVYYLYQLRPDQRQQRLLKKGIRAFQAEKYDLALAFIERSKRGEQITPYTHYLQGSVLHNQKKYNAAYKAFETYLELDPADDDTRLLMAHCQYGLHRYQAAVDLLADISPDFVRYMRVAILTGDCCLKLQLPEAALLAFEKGLLVRESFGGERQELLQKITDVKDG